MAGVLRLMGIAIVLLVVFAGSANAQLGDVGAKEQATANGILQSLVTGVDPTLADTAVTPNQLAAAGVWVDAAPTLLSDPNMLVVDDDRAQCPDAQFSSINTAVLEATPGALIRVCPGLYRESVQITKPLTIQAPRHQGQATECQSAPIDDPTQYAILEYNGTPNGGNPTEGFDVEAPNVTIDGMTIEPDPSLVTHDGVGIFTSNAFAGYDIRHNVLQRNTMGVYFNSAGTSYVRENCFRANNLSGAAAGNGVYSDQGLQNSQITNNYFTGHENAAVVVDTFLATPTGNEITHNEAVNDSSIVVADSANTTISYNKVTNPNGSGIVTVVLSGGEISYNDVLGGPASFNGVSLHSTDHVTVKSNHATGFTLDGVRLGDQSDNNLVATNRADNNGQAGLQATEQSSNNTIRENHMSGNHPDCSDNTAGLGTAGTANLWINDTGYTEDRIGICKHATP